MSIDILIPLAIVGFVAIGLLVVGLISLRLPNRPRGLARPDLERMGGDPVYFQRAMFRIFKERGYRVTGWKFLQGQFERETMAVVFALRKGGQLYCAFCLRWFVPVTSDDMLRFEKARQTTRAGRAIVVTAGDFTPAAIDQGRALPFELYNRDDLAQWIETIWPA